MIQDGHPPFVTNAITRWVRPFLVTYTTYSAKTFARFSLQNSPEVCVPVLLPERKYRAPEEELDFACKGYIFLRWVGVPAFLGGVIEGGGIAAGLGWLPPLLQIGAV
jgi:hypothetical protein